MELRNHDNSSRNAGELLSKRQVYFLSLLAAGFTVDEIADQLCISSQAVHTEMDSLFDKIRASNRPQAVLWAVKNF